MMKMSYETVKRELQKRCSNVKHFSKAFYNIYKKSLSETIKNAEKGIDDSYYKGIVKLYHSWDEVYNSKFYRENGCAYCEFLSIVYGVELI